MKYTKAVLAAVFGLPPAAVVGVLVLLGVHVDVATVVAVGGVLGPVLATLGVAVGPANAPKAPQPDLEHEPPAELTASWLTQSTQE